MNIDTCSHGGKWTDAKSGKFRERTCALIEKSIGSDKLLVTDSGCPECPQVDDGTFIHVSIVTALKRAIIDQWPTSDTCKGCGLGITLDATVAVLQARTSPEIVAEVLVKAVENGMAESVAQDMAAKYAGEVKKL